jgi:hypothetical protein
MIIRGTLTMITCKLSLRLQLHEASMAGMPRLVFRLGGDAQGSAELFRDIKHGAHQPHPFESRCPSVDVARVTGERDGDDDWAVERGGGRQDDDRSGASCTARRSGNSSLKGRMGNPWRRRCRAGVGGEGQRGEPVVRCPAPG